MGVGELKLMREFSVYLFDQSSMAERQGNSSCSEEKIQSMVFNIFGELLEARHSQQTGNSSGQHISVASEINQRFRLPRTARQTENVNMIPTRPSVIGVTLSTGGISMTVIPSHLQPRKETRYL